jgi:hypothetical protein
MKHMSKPAAAAVAVLLLGACTEQTPETSYRPVLDVKQTMTLALEPAADLIWDSAGFVTTEEGETDLSPTTDEGWLAVRQAAAVVTETGNLLVMPGRAVDRQDWAEISMGLVTVGERALAAAEARDAEALFAVGGELYNVCLSCHQLYWTEGERIQ